MIAGLILSLCQCLYNCVCNRCCRDETRDAQRLRDLEEEEAIRQRAQDARARGPTAYEVTYHFDASTWANAVAALGWGPCGALLAALARLLLFHWLQPLVYLAGLAAFWSELGFWQAAFATVVAAREVAYLVLMVAVCFVRPAFLLIDVPAGWARKVNHRTSTVLYVAAPELLAASTVFSGNGALGPWVFFPLWISDVAGVLALAAALHSGVTPPPLMVGYAVTVVAGVAGVVAAGIARAR